MPTRNYTDPWSRPSPARSSGDRWSDPSPSEKRFFAHDSDAPRQSWSSDADLDPGRYAPTSTRRTQVARVIGVLGVIGVLALAAAAFAPRVQAVTSQLARLAQHVELPWDPALQPGPAPLALDRGPTLASSEPSPATEPATASPEATTPATSPEAVAPPSEPLSDVDSSAESQGATASPPPTASDAATSDAFATSDAVPAGEMSTPKRRTEAPSSEPRRAVRSSQSAGESREPALTPEEIEMRERRYEEWLESEGLQRIP
jgi:hypothetical protein